MNRDPRYDFFRGLALLAMTAEFAGGMRGEVGRDLLISPITLFLFVSGLVYGRAWSKRVESQGFLNCQFCALRNSGTMTLAALVTFAVCLALIWQYRHVPAAQPMTTSIPAYLAQRFEGFPQLLARAPELLSLLGCYIILVALAPLAIQLYLHNRPLPTLISLMAVVTGMMAVSTYVFAVPRAFGNLLIWQFLFYLGLSIGAERARGAIRFPKQRRVVAAVLVVLVASASLRYSFRPPFAMPWAVIELLLASYVIAAGLPTTCAIWQSEWLFPFTSCGRRSLLTLCCGIVVSQWVTLVGQAQRFEFGGFALLNVVGIAAIMLTGMALQLIADRHSFPADAPEWVTN